MTTDMSVRETVARALFDTTTYNRWAAHDQETVGRAADAVLAAVAAHDGLAPLLRAHTYHNWVQDCRCRIAGDDAMDGDDWAAHLADVVRAWLRGES